MTRVEAIINSMTLKERAQPGIINTSRKRRIARGSGFEINDINKLLKNFQKSRKLMKNMGRMKGKKGMDSALGGMGGWVANHFLFTQNRFYWRKERTCR